VAPAPAPDDDHLELLFGVGLLVGVVLHHSHAEVHARSRHRGQYLRPAFGPVVLVQGQNEVAFQVKVVLVQVPDFTVFEGPVGVVLAAQQHHFVFVDHHRPVQDPFFQHCAVLMAKTLDVLGFVQCHHFV